MRGFWHRFGVWVANSGPLSIGPSRVARSCFVHNQPSTRKTLARSPDQHLTLLGKRFLGGWRKSFRERERGRERERKKKTKGNNKRVRERGRKRRRETKREDRETAREGEREVVRGREGERHREREAPRTFGGGRRGGGVIPLEKVRYRGIPTEIRRVRMTPAKASGVSCTPRTCQRQNRQNP